jgi:3-deoxy-D-manno-octulosonic-acid transferase
MIVLYNLVQCAAVLMLFPFLLLGVLWRAKYRSRTLRRCGFGLASLLSGKRKKRPCFWVHALSVGEVRSCKPLLQALRCRHPEATVFLSTTTSTGEKAAEGHVELVDAVIAFPFDFWFSVVHFLEVIRPDIFVLVETDFWPNMLYHLRRRKIPSLLVNGRISKKSLQAYINHKWLFLPIFSSFSRLYMQTEEYAENMRVLGLGADRVKAAGNLKYDAALASIRNDDRDVVRPMKHQDGGFLFVAGSTHEGEEVVLFRVFAQLLKRHPGWRMVIAPRDIERAPQLLKLGARNGLQCALRINGPPASGEHQVLLLNTFGELSSFYRRSDAVFVGGSLVAAGGHNPLEAAVFRKPILFGTHMDDFAEIRRDLLAGGGAVEVKDEAALLETLQRLLADVPARGAMGEAAFETVLRNSGAAEAIVGDIGNLLESGIGFQAGQGVG